MELFQICYFFSISRENEFLCFISMYIYTTTTAIERSTEGDKSKSDSYYELVIPKHTIYIPCTILIIIIIIEWPKRKMIENSRQRVV